MKFRNLLAVAILGATSVALAQGTTTYTNSCQAASYSNLTPCAALGHTNLVAVYPEGLTLTVPNQINFILIPNQLAQGDKPLTAVVTWNLASTPQGLGGGFSNLYVDAYFRDAGAGAMTPSYTSMGANIPYNNIEGSLNGLGGTTAFGIPITDLSDPILNYDAAGALEAFPMGQWDISTAPSGTQSPYLDLYIDFTSGAAVSMLPATGGGPANPNQINPDPTGTWQGVVYVAAMAY